MTGKRRIRERKQSNRERRELRWTIVRVNKMQKFLEANPDIWKNLAFCIREMNNKGDPDESAD